VGNLPDTGPVRLPPTQPRKTRRARPRWVKPVAIVSTLALTAAGVSAVLNREVSRRLATVPPATTTTTSTSIVVAVAPPVTPPQVMGARVSRPAQSAPTTTSTTVMTPQTPEVFEAETPSKLIAELEKLPVKEERKDGYARAKYGFYKDADRDGCSTREEVAVAEAVSIDYNPRGCRIESGTWLSLFDGKTVSLPDLRVTHLVSLREVWESGGWEWDDATRNLYLNDLKHPETLIAVSEVSEEARKDEDPGSWLPSNNGYLCEYLRSWVYVKTVYKLAVDPGEREAIAAASLYC
jgi:hypothetical protein